MATHGSIPNGLIRTSRRPTIPDSPQSVADLLTPIVERTPDEEALVSRHTRYGYAELDRAANRAAHTFLSLGIEPGDRIAASIGNHSEIVVAFLGAMRIGAIWVGINRALAAAEKSHVLADSSARIFLGDREMLTQIEGIRAELPRLERTIETEPGADDSEWANRLARASSEERPKLDVDPFAPAAIAYTSGTTGRPKGAVHSQHNMLMPGAIAKSIGRSGPDVTVGFALPMTILNVFILGPILAAQAGAKCVLMDRNDAVGIADWIRRERVVRFSSVPATYHDLLTRPEIAAADLDSLTQPGVGGANCPDEFRELFRERFGQEVQVGYGLTEAPTSVSHTNPEGPTLPGCSGSALPHIELSIRDEADRDVAPGNEGEICVGPRRDGIWADVYTPMLGYWNQPLATEEALRGGWLHTGDIGVLDPEGNLFVRDRRSDLILRGGANIYPAEVERVLHTDRRIAACAVLGVADARLGQRVAAAVQLEPEINISTEELQTLCASQLARYKVPDRFVFLDEFPRNSMGKILKRELVSLFESPGREDTDLERVG